MRGTGEGLGVEDGACVHVQLVQSWRQHSRELPLHAPRRQVVDDGLQRIAWLSFNPQQFPSVALFHVTRQMVLPSKALGAVLAEEVFASGVHHHVPSHVFTGVKPPLAMLATMFFLLGPTGGLASMCFEVFQKNPSAGEWLQAHLAGEVSTVGSVEGKVAFETQLRVVALATLLTSERLLVWIVSV